MAKNPTVVKAGDVLDGIDDLLDTADPEGLTAPARRELMRRVEEMRDRLDRLTRKVDTIDLPDAFFDPADPALIGNFVALAMIAQERRSLAGMTPFYGAGIYAIYYNGDADPYGPISGTETPIYVGKADPDGGAKTVVDQGTKLHDRLREHRRTIEKVAGIDLSEFECRALAVQSGYQAAAEAHLIRLFRPIWNNETKILFGIGKHGDSAKTRANKRSPFDTLHPGRAWAEGNEPTKSPDEIRAEAAAHFESTRVFGNTSEVIEAFIENIRREDRLEPDDEAAGSTTDD